MFDRRTLLQAGLALSATLAAPVRRAAASTGAYSSVDTSAGRLRGRRSGALHVFKGVPYAASSAGANRFLPPQKLPAWTGTRDALVLGPRAPQEQAQIVDEFGVMDRTEPSGEDCLCLNLWTRALHDGGKRPVMVWLHGGGFAGGSAGFSIYDGSRLAERHDVVFVGVNHRLNAFGFLYLRGSALKRWSGSSNVGMLDIVAALEWVRDNIERFGGDPDNVTIFGQSGGGSKVSTLLGMPSAKGLFHRAIAMSGSQVRSQSVEQADALRARTLELLKLSADSEQLQQMPYYELRDAIGQAAGLGGALAFAPVMDAQSIPAHPFDPLATELSSHVPLLIGSTETEVTWNTHQQYDALDDGALRHYLKLIFKCEDAELERLIELYRDHRPHASNLDLYLLMATDASGFRRGTNLQAERKAAQNKAPVYKYYFDWYSPVREGRLRCMHTMDIPFALDNVALARTEIGEDGRLQDLADQMSAAWVAFARAGMPSHAGLRDWPAYSAARRSTMMLDERARVLDDPNGEPQRAVETLLTQQEARRRGV